MPLSYPSPTEEDAGALSLAQMQIEAEVLYGAIDDQSGNLLAHATRQREIIRGLQEIAEATMKAIRLPLETSFEYRRLPDAVRLTLFRTLVETSRALTIMGAPWVAIGGGSAMYLARSLGRAEEYLSALEGGIRLLQEDEQKVLPIDMGMGSCLSSSLSATHLGIGERMNDVVRETLGQLLPVTVAVADVKIEWDRDVSRGDLEIMNISVTFAA